MKRAIYIFALAVALATAGCAIDPVTHEPVFKISHEYIEHMNQVRWEREHPTTP